MKYLIFIALLYAASAHAHKPSDSYLHLQADGRTLQGQWDIALRDLEHAIGLDANGDGAITWGELRARHADIAAYALSRLKLRADGRTCALAPTGHLVDEHSDGAYSVLRFSARCGTGAYRQIEVEYELFFDLDPSHRGLLRIERPAGTITGVLGPERPRFQFALTGGSRLTQFFDYAREGVWHIWIGFDHILFLLSLLLPSVLVFASKEWTAAERFRDAFWDVFKIVRRSRSPIPSPCRSRRCRSSCCRRAWSSRRSRFRCCWRP